MGRAGPGLGQFCNLSNLCLWHFLYNQQPFLVCPATSCIYYGSESHPCFSKPLHISFPLCPSKGFSIVTVASLHSRKREKGWNWNSVRHSFLFVHTRALTPPSISRRTSRGTRHSSSSSSPQARGVVASHNVVQTSLHFCPHEITYCTYNLHACFTHFSGMDFSNADLQSRHVLTKGGSRFEKFEERDHG